MGEIISYKNDVIVVNFHPVLFGDKF